MSNSSRTDGATADAAVKALAEGLRLGVERLLEARRSALVGAWEQHGGATLYAAACRLLMRRVVAVYARARGLCFQPDRDCTLDPALALFDSAAEAFDDELTRRVAREELVALPTEMLGGLYEGLLADELRRVGDRIELVRCAGTRKGAGSFYTPPQLSTPTVERTLEPLVYAHDGRICAPEQLLALTLCDPAMGSGSFLVAALRVLTTALLESLRAHGRTPVSEAGVRRLLVERCLHGVDLDPVAVEIARATLWIEVGDPELPASAITSKLRCGDALLGAWRDRVGHYPLLALSRERLDDEGIRRALARRRRAVIRDQVDLLEGRAVGSDSAVTPEQFDSWCALWFWPLDQVGALPLPSQLHDLSPEARAIVEGLRAQLRFFHWELEFPEVFTGEDAGFDAILGNPPWEIQKLNSKEFFSKHDPDYRGYGKQHALRVQAALFADNPGIEGRWRASVREFVDRAHYVRHAAEPFGDARSAAQASLARGRRGAALHERWRAQRARELATCDREHPFHHQGSADLNTYKMFVELGHALLRPGGQLGMIVPSGLYTDKGSAELRALLLRRCRWRWLYGFENRAGIFAIHRNFKFCIIIAQKHGRTDAITAAFMRCELDDWPAKKAAMAYPAERVADFSPSSLGILEIQSARDLAVIGKLYEHGVMLGDCGIRYATEFHTTNDSASFVARDRAEAEGLRPDEYGRWTDQQRVLLPLYEGRMLGQFDFSAKGWVRGAGRGAVWRAIPADAKRIAPQFLVCREHAVAGKMNPGPKVAYMRIASATNSRTVIATYLRDVPAGDSVFYFVADHRPIATSLAVVAMFNSFVYDWVVRTRLGGLNLSEFIMVETPLIPALPDEALRLTLALVGGAAWFAPEWLALDLSRERPWRRHWAVTRHERLRLRCMLDAIVAVYYGLERAELAWILRDCDLPTRVLGSKAFCRRLDPKGFWRVDKTEPPQLRHSVLTLAAFDALQATIAAAGERGLGTRAFCEQHEGEGWQLPDTLRLDELGLLRSVELAEPRGELPVRGLLGPRFVAWQLDQSAEHSWAECERHAAALAAER